MCDHTCVPETVPCSGQCLDSEHLCGEECIPKTRACNNFCPNTELFQFLPKIPNCDGVCVDYTVLAMFFLALTTKDNYS